MDLKPGEIKCEHCDGLGNFGFNVSIEEFEYRGIIHRVPLEKTMILCDKCCGTGKLDWIEAVVGKKSLGDIDI